MLIGIDLLWVRHGINGGTESVIRNLLKAFGETGAEEFLLFVSRDNADSFSLYRVFPNMKFHICDVDSADPVKRVIWQTLHLDKMAAAEKVDLMFSPIYSIPRHKKSGIPYVAVIHDMQALHFSEYFGRVRNIFFRRSWKNTCKNAAHVITISDYCKDEIIKFYPKCNDRITRIYDPVDIQIPGEEDKETVEQVTNKYGVKFGAYDYCVSSLLPHKNLDTLLKMKSQYREDAVPLLISGVGGRIDEFNTKVKALGLDKQVINTGFVSDEERNALYAGCRLFLFPSVFEGFGMPPIEALAFGKRVVMTKEACLEEVTKGNAVYVDDPFDPSEWNDKIRHALQLKEKTVIFPEYHPHRIASEYLEVFRSVKREHI